MKRFMSSDSRGFTLVELLITITILVSLAVIVIPTVRLLTRDRKVRETARVVGSMFAAAREQAAVDGLAGVEIVTNPNVPQYATTLYRLRALPEFRGDYYDHAVAVENVMPPPNSTTAGSATVRFYRRNPPMPIQQRISLELKPGDFIELNDGGVWYLITNVVKTLVPPFETIAVNIRIQPNEPIPPHNPVSPHELLVDFMAIRQPQRVETSVINLPPRLFVNMGYSGHGVDTNQFATVAPNGSIEVWFDRKGSVDRINQDGVLSYPVGSVYLLICTGDGDEVYTTDLVPTPTNTPFIEDADNRWLVIDKGTGNVSVGRLAAIDPTSATVPERLRDARQLANNRQSATP